MRLQSSRFGSCGRRSPRGCGEATSLENVERELIAPSGLSEELQSALWLYGWSLSQ
jgi:hypothetical protein